MAAPTPLAFQEKQRNIAQITQNPQIEIAIALI
jgi:hypothetical protein